MSYCYPCSLGFGRGHCKSCFLRLIIDELRNRQIDPEHILYINKELLDYDFIRNYKDLNRHVQKMFSGLKGPKYLFVDEIQDNYPKYVVSLDTDFGTDVEGIRRLHLIEFLLNDHEL